MTGFLVVGDGRPWRIPGHVPAVAVPAAELVNSCGDPDCKGSSDHAPDQRHVFATPPAALPRALAVKTGMGH